MAVKSTVVNFAVVSVERGIWARDNAIREAEIALQLRHPNIVTTYARVLPPNQDRSTGPSPLSPPPPLPPRPLRPPNSSSNLHARAHTQTHARK